MDRDAEDRDEEQKREVPDVVRRLEERRERYQHRSVAYRVGWTTGGFLVLAAGIAMTVFPGPAVIVIPAGLAMLSFEFTWAERVLDFALTRGMDAKQYAEHLDRRHKWMLAIAGACLLAALAGGIAVYVA